MNRTAPAPAAVEADRRRRTAQTVADHLEALAERQPDELARQLEALARQLEPRVKARPVVRVDVRGTDEEHAERLADHVRGWLRGIGLAYRTDDDRTAGRWPGSADTFVLDEHGEHLALETLWHNHVEAERVARLLAEWVDANLWGPAVVLVSTPRYLDH